MSFFDTPPPPSPSPEPSPPAPPWVQPPQRWIGGPLSTVVELVEGEQVAIFVSGFVAFPTGVMFDVRLVTREPRRPGSDSRPPFLMQHALQAEPREELPDEFVRFGVLLADGNKATNFDNRLGFRDFFTEPESPVLMPRGGGGSEHTWSMRFWLWPLPPDGPLTFVIEWPQFQIPETQASIDAAEIRTAAERARPIWSDV